MTQPMTKIILLALLTLAMMPGASAQSRTVYEVLGSASALRRLTTAARRRFAMQAARSAENWAESAEAGLGAE
jgi:hypothetical protein